MDMAASTCGLTENVVLSAGVNMELQEICDAIDAMKQTAEDLQDALEAAEQTIEDMEQAKAQMGEPGGGDGNDMVFGGP